jgi:hypothetical protein
MTLADLASNEPARAVAGLPQSLANGFTIKYSGFRESFSPYCIRGIHSSRTRAWRGGTTSDEINMLTKAIAAAPEGTVALVFQELLQQPSLRGPFAAHFTRNHAVTESLASGERRLAVQDGSQLVTELVQGKHIKALNLANIDYEYVLDSLRAFSERFDFDLNVEGFQADKDIILVQMRPIPEDMPVSMDLESEIQACLNIEEMTKWHHTRWVWGSGRFEGTVDMEIPDGPAIMIKRLPSLTECGRILSRLDDGLPTLVIDTVDAFHLEHGPQHLPLDPAKRHLFSYISVANSPLHNLSSGQHVTAIISGARGIIKPN